MLIRRSTRHVFLFSLIACVLFCTMATAEMPELLSCTDDTSNDFTLRESASAESARAVSTAPQRVVERFLATSTQVFIPRRLVTLHNHPAAALSPLLILISVLRT
jgi:hypothetical protein